MEKPMIVQAPPSGTDGTPSLSRVGSFPPVAQPKPLELSRMFGPGIVERSSRMASLVIVDDLDLTSLQQELEVQRRRVRDLHEPIEGIHSGIVHRDALDSIACMNEGRRQAHAQP